MKNTKYYLIVNDKGENKELCIDKLNYYKASILAKHKIKKINKTLNTYKDKRLISQDDRIQVHNLMMEKKSCQRILEISDLIRKNLYT